MLQEYYNEKETSRNFKRLLTEAGHNNSSLAEAVGVSEGTIRNLCNENKPFNPPTKTIVAIARELGVPTTKIFVMR